MALIQCQSMNDDMRPLWMICAGLLMMRPDKRDYLLANDTLPAQLPGSLTVRSLEWQEFA